MAPGDVGDDRVRLRGEDARHLAVVLRARPGDPVSVSDGRGGLWQGRFARAAGDEAVVELTRRLDRAAGVPSITVVHALPKQRKLDEVVGRLTELDVARIVPVHSARSEVSLTGDKATKAQSRWTAVARAAAKQSRRAHLPEIAPVGQWTTAFGDAVAGVVMWEESATPLHTVLDAGATAPALTLAIGPEGGLTREEVDATGLPDASLGDTILRTETAAIVAVSAVRYATGLMVPPQENPT